MGSLGHCLDRTDKAPCQRKRYEHHRQHHSSCSKGKGNMELTEEPNLHWIQEMTGRKQSGIPHGLALINKGTEVHFFALR